MSKQDETGTKITEVFKFQAEQSPNYRGSVMIYNQDRTIGGQIPMTPTYNELFNKYGEKFYAKGEYDDITGIVTVIKVTKERSW